MAYIFKNNKELNKYVCEIENLRILSWINYNYYDDGDVYSISDKDELTLDEILMFTDSSFSLEFIIEQKDIYKDDFYEDLEDLTVKEEQILHEIRRRIYNAKHLYVNLDDKINREEFGISNGISCQYFSVEDLKFSIDSYRNFDLNELKEKIEKIKSIKFNDEYKNLRKNRICKYLIDILEEKKEKIKEINKYIENLRTKEFMEIMDFINDEVTVIEDKNNDNISDVINSPEHYQLNIKGNNIEVIDVIDEVVKDYNPKQAFRVANILKYILRASKKNGLEDFKKAKKYIEMLLEME